VTEALCGQGPTPKAASIERFRAMGLDQVPGTGLLPAVVPGAFDGWLALLAAKGTMILRDVLEPAILYARRGVPVDSRLHATLQASRNMFMQHWPTSRAIFLPDGAPPPVGGLLANPALADTWQRLLGAGEAAGADRQGQIEAARACWSDGFVAEAIDRFCRTTVAMDVSGSLHGALLTGDDLSGWRAGFEAPVTRPYGAFLIAKCGPWTQGPALLQALDLLPPDEMADLDPLGGPFVHRVAEALKLALADRETFYGDPDWVDVPLDRLLCADYAAGRRALIGARADNGWRPGKLEGFDWQVDYAAACERKRAEGLLGAYGGGEPTVQDLTYRASVAGDTCHLDVVDAAGNMVSATPSGGWLQSSPAIPELGFPLGTRAQMMWLDDRAPSALGPGRRPPRLRHSRRRPAGAVAGGLPDPPSGPRHGPAGGHRGAVVPRRARSQLVLPAARQSGATGHRRPLRPGGPGRPARARS
jgi:gamma-glutamyltranspeptidase/glutathione hydrolase